MTELIMNKDLLIGVVSGLITSGLIWIFMIILTFVKNSNVINVCTKSKIIHIYDSFDKAKNQIMDDINRPGIMYVFSNYEPFLLSVAYHDLLKENKDDIRFLMVEPNSCCAHAELAVLDRSL